MLSRLSVSFAVLAVLLSSVLYLLSASDASSDAQVPTASGLGYWLDNYMQLLERPASGAEQRDEQPAPAATNELSNNLVGGEQASPIILVPGYGGSRLEAKWKKDQAKHYFCQTHQPDWTNIWIDIKLLMPYMIDCLIENFRLEFDRSTNRTHNTEGVEIRVKDPDNIESVEFLNDLHMSSFAYFAPIIRHLTSNFDYKRNENITGAPYDFRKAPNELGEFFAKLRTTSENMFARNEQRPITYICHSMGCNNILYFLQRQSKQWKAKHVKRIISLAAPWAGSLMALRAVAKGDNLNKPYLFDEAKLNIVQRSVPSTIYLFPNEKAFKDVPLVRDNVFGDKPEDLTRANDYKSFFDRLQHPDGYLMWLNTKDLLGSLEAPQVEVWCLYGEQVRTLGRLEFEGSFPSSREIDLYDDGDGTVSTQSSTYCKHWQNEQTQPVHLKGFPSNHMELLRDRHVLEAIENIIRYDNTEPK